MSLIRYRIDSTRIIVEGLIGLVYRNHKLGNSIIVMIKSWVNY